MCLSEPFFVLAADEVKDLSLCATRYCRSLCTLACPAELRWLRLGIGTHIEDHHFLKSLLWWLLCRLLSLYHALRDSDQLKHNTALGFSDGTRCIASALLVGIRLNLCEEFAALSFLVLLLFSQDLLVLLLLGLFLLLHFALSLKQTLLVLLLLLDVLLHDHGTLVSQFFDLCTSFLLILTLFPLLFLFKVPERHTFTHSVTFRGI